MASVTPSTMTGKVVVASTGQGVAGVTADLFGAGNGTVPVASAASDDTGAFAFGRLPAGRYRAARARRRVRRAVVPGLADVRRRDRHRRRGERAASTLEDIEIGGRPGIDRGRGRRRRPDRAPSPSSSCRGVADPDADALVDEVTVSADGSFQFADVPSPGNYQLIVDKPGFATQTRDITLGAAEELEGIKVVLREGDGVIAGRVSSPTVRSAASTSSPPAATSSSPTVSLTLDDVGAFTRARRCRRRARTRSRSSATATSRRRAPSTSAAAQQLSGLAVTMAPTTGSISGTRELGGRRSLGGVTVDGHRRRRRRRCARRRRASATSGAYGFGALPVAGDVHADVQPRTGYVSQSRLVELGGATGRRAASPASTPSWCPARPIIRGVDPRRRRPAGRRRHRRAQRRGRGPPGAVGRRPARPLRVHATSRPGAYTLTAALPGTSPAVRLVNVIANDVGELDIRLEAQASLFGTRRCAIDGGVEIAPYAGAVRAAVPAAGLPGPAATRARRRSQLRPPTARTRSRALDAPADFVVAVYNAPRRRRPRSRLVQSSRARRPGATIPSVRAPPPETIARRRRSRR